MYLLFLDFVLPLVTNLNLEMQSEKPKIYILYAKVHSLFKTILELFVKTSCFKGKDITQIDYKCPPNFLSFNDVHVGGTLIAFIESNPEIPEAELDQFKNTCVQFYIELLDQIKMRFDFKRDDLKNMAFIEPINILNRKNTSIIPLAKQFP